MIQAIEFYNDGFKFSYGDDDAKRDVAETMDLVSHLLAFICQVMSKIGFRVGFCFGHDLE